MIFRQRAENYKVKFKCIRNFWFEFNKHFQEIYIGAVTLLFLPGVQWLEITAHA